MCIYITALKPGSSYFVADYERSWEFKGFYGGEDIAVPITISAKEYHYGVDPSYAPKTSMYNSKPIYTTPNSYSNIPVEPMPKVSYNDNYVVTEQKSY